MKSISKTTYMAIYKNHQKKRYVPRHHYMFIILQRIMDALLPKYVECTMDDIPNSFQGVKIDFQYESPRYNAFLHNCSREFSEVFTFDEATEEISCKDFNKFYKLVNKSEIGKPYMAH